MAKKTKIILSHFHRSQIGRAQRYIRLNSSKDLSLKTIAREAGSSSFHFGRLFMAYTGETVFEFLRRVRMAMAGRLLQEDSEGAITEIAMDIGYDTPSAFNKVFKSTLKMSPTEFRNLGKEVQNQLLYHLSQPVLPKEADMNMDLKPEFVIKTAFHYLYNEERGPFAEAAVPAWNELFPKLEKLDKAQITGFLGMSGLDKSKTGDEAMIYQAGIAMKEKPATIPKGLVHKKIGEGRYAKFLLKGSYTQIWPAFRQIFKTLSENKTVLREEFCIEDYLNDPKTTPEDQLLTEILIPVK